jgi:2-aminoadipate transaminase
VSYSYAKRVQNIKSSAVRDILKVLDRQNMISFAGGLPSDELFPLDAVEAAFEKTFKGGKKSLQYGLTEGFTPLREIIVSLLAARKIETSVERILVTTGSQQAIDLFARTTVDPGDIVLTENPTYLAANQVFSSYEAKIIPVLSDDEGMDPEDLEKKIQEYKPKCIYVVPTFSNPLGRVWSLSRRKSALQIAKKYGVIIFEDDPYGELKFHLDEEYRPIASLDDGKNVLYTSTFSKTVVPALRTGWVTGPSEIIHMMAQFKQAADLHSNSLSQQALYHLLTDFDLNNHIQEIRDEYKKRMLLMDEYLRKANIEGMSYIPPKGGMFLWLKLDPSINTTELLTKAVDQGVAYVPGAPFYVTDPEQNTLRLNFSHSSPEKIKEGIRILSRVFEEALQGAQK